MAKELAHNQILHGLFDLLPIANTCGWYGTEWEADGKSCKPCGEPSVGAGMFCDATNPEWCQYITVCERHSHTSERFE